MATDVPADGRGGTAPQAVDPRTWDSSAGAKRATGHEAVCFTAGADGVPFAAGVVHAYLAADRPPPSVVAGISAGALSAAAFVASFDALQGSRSRSEADRWRWFRSYVATLAHQPLARFLEGLPGYTELSTLHGAVRPISHPAAIEAVLPVPERGSPNSSEGERLRNLEREALGKRFLLQGLWRWAGGLRVRIGDVAGLLYNRVAFVELRRARSLERNGEQARHRRLERHALTGVGKYARALWYTLLLVLGAVEHLALAPNWVNAAPFDGAASRWPRWLPRPRPLFGGLWPVALAVFLLVCGVLPAALVLAARALTGTCPPVQAGAGLLARWCPSAAALAHGHAASLALWWGLLGALLVALVTLGLGWELVARARRSRWPRRNDVTKAAEPGGRKRSAWLQHVMECTGLSHSLLPDFHLQLFLRRLFGQVFASRDLSKGATRLVLVASPLQTLGRTDGTPPLPAGAAAGAAPSPPASSRLPRSTHQVWALLNRSGAVIDALHACLALPGLFRPITLGRDAFQEDWDCTALELPEGVTVQLVDAAVIRLNPLPALFDFLKRRAPDLADAIEAANDLGRAGVHVVYGVPVEELRAPQRSPEMPDIIDVARKSLSLARRCDTQLEVAQTNFEARLAELRQRLPGDERGDARRHIFADEIAPVTRRWYANPLEPCREEVLSAVAEGCRRTLGRLYAEEVRQANASGTMRCEALLARVARERRADPATGAPGCAEVCRHCTRCVEAPPPPPPPVAEALDCAHFPQLKREPAPGKGSPRVVLLTSGGVFRGAFHIGMAGALHQAALKPDLIVGASVGTLMGAAIGTLTRLRLDGSEDEAQRRLRQLTDMFFQVDRKVALTRTLQYAARMLALRSLHLRLSPRAVRKMLERGARGDPGFAAVGAPPALLDALSDMFLLPHRRTSELASLVVAGRLAEATNGFLKLLRSETLPRLGIREAVLGTSLLELRAGELLALGPTQVTDGPWGLGCGGQPFMGTRTGLDADEVLRRQIAFFGTTTDLGTESMQLLGALAPGAEPFDVVEATLASSAFPAVFAPRCERQVRPGRGRDDVFLADGGMFDNLPFLPAYDILRAAQLSEHAALLRRACSWDAQQRLQGQEELLGRLKELHQRPDLFLVGALNVNPEQQYQGQPKVYEDLSAISSRAGSLHDNVKIRSFERSSVHVRDQFGAILEEAGKALTDGQKACLSDADCRLLAGFVDAAILPVFPASAAHLNPTFAFSASTGLQPRVVARTIADGCYQTLRALANDAPPPQSPAGPSPHVQEALSELRKVGRVPSFTHATPRSEKQGRNGPTRGGSDRVCPFFRKGGPPAQPFTCPFAGSESGDAVFHACRSDQHRP